MILRVGNETFNFDLVTRTTYNREGNVLDIFFVGSERPWAVEGNTGKKLWEYLKRKSTLVA